MFIVNPRELICQKKNEIIKRVEVEGIRIRKKSRKFGVNTWCEYLGERGVPSTNNLKNCPLNEKLRNPKRPGDFRRQG